METKQANCPMCGSDRLGDRWVAGRKLQQHCLDFTEDDGFPCEWEGESRVPEQRPIRRSKSVMLNSSGCYEIFDRYGYTMVLSASFLSKRAAMPHIQAELRRGATDADAGPYTALWWSGTTYSRGTIVSLKD